MSDISKSSLGESFDAEFERAVANCSTAAEISELMKNRAVQTLPGVTRDIFDPSVILVDESAVRTPQRFAQAITDPTTGNKVVFEGDSEIEVTRQANEYLRGLFAQPAVVEQTRDERGRFVEPNITDATTRIEGDLVTRALEAQGIDPEALREFSEQRRQQEWMTAVEAFKGRHSDWIGGEENKNLMGNLIIKNPDAFAGLSPLESLEKAYAYVVAQNMLVENPEVTARERIANANSPEEIRSALGRSSSMFGR